jgi:hypothetical protein
MIGGRLLSGAAALANTARVDEAPKLKSSAAGIEVECTGDTLDGIAPEIKSPNAAVATSLEFTECKVVTPDCRLSSSTLPTVPVAVEVTLDGALAVIATIKPKTKSIFATFELVGEKCSASGLIAATGTEKILAPTDQESTLYQGNVVTTEESGELRVDGNPVAVTGGALLKLASGEPWTFL